MVLNIQGYKSIFPNSNANDEGLGQRKLKNLSLSLSAHAFVADSRTATANMRYGDGFLSISETITGTVWASVSLPDGAIINSAIVLGNDFTWELRRMKRNTFPTLLIASGNANVKDITIDGAIIDHDKYVYWFVVEMATESQLNGAVIEYEN